MAACGALQTGYYYAEKEFDTMGRRIVVCVGTTGTDRHGERFSREFFRDLLPAPDVRVPLYSEHDAGGRSIGYAENYRMEPDPFQEGEWRVLADLELADGVSEADVENIVRGGFSWTGLELVGRNYGGGESPLLGIYLPRSVYRSRRAFEHILRLPVPLVVGRVYRKGWETADIALIVSGSALMVSTANFVLAPAWRKFYEDVIHPRLVEAWARISQLRSNSTLSIDYVHRFHSAFGVVEVHFVPERGLEQQCLQAPTLLRGLEAATRILGEDALRGRGQVSRIRLVYRPQKQRYVAYAIEYESGETVHL